MTESRNSELGIRAKAKRRLQALGSGLWEKQKQTKSVHNIDTETRRKTKVIRKLKRRRSK